MRQGQQNYDLLRNRTTTELNARVDDMALYKVGAYPMMTDGDGTVHGDLIHLQPFLYNDLLRQLDRAEGFYPEKDIISLYRRELIDVQIDATGHRVIAWAYVGQKQLLNSHSTHIECGDWVQYRLNTIRQTRYGRFMKNTIKERNF